MEPINHEEESILDSKSPIIEGRVAKIEFRVGLVERRIDKVDDSINEIKNQVQLQRDGQIRTQTLLEGVQAKVDLVSNKLDQTLSVLNDYKVNASTKEAENWKYAFWFIAGILITGILALVGVKVFHL